MKSKIIAISCSVIICITTIRIIIHLQENMSKQISSDYSEQIQEINDKLEIIVGQKHDETGKNDYTSRELPINVHDISYEQIENIKQKIDSNVGYIGIEGLVPDEETAVKIAEAIWLPVYGPTIYNKQPFNATYYGELNCWYIYGSLPQGIDGGVPEILIQKKDGKVLFVKHGK